MSGARKRRAFRREDGAPLQEIRPGVVRVSFEMPTELALRVGTASQVRGLSKGVLWRTAMILFLQEHTKLPDGPKPGTTAFALAAARSLKDGNANLERVLGPRDESVEKIFGMKS